MEKIEYDRQKTEKEKERKKELTKRRIKKLIPWILFLFIGVGVGLFLIPKVKPLGPDYSKEMPEEGRSHVVEGTKVTYQSNPPTSGPHWPIPLSDGVYDKEKPDEAIVHSLEHGRVWISFRPTIPESAKSALKKIAKGKQAVILTPRSANETDIALCAWGRLDKFNLNEDGSFDQKRVLDFIYRYRNKGPEFVPGQGGGKTYE